MPCPEHVEGEGEVGGGVGDAERPDVAGAYHEPSPDESRNSADHRILAVLDAEKHRHDHNYDRSDTDYSSFFR